MIVQIKSKNYTDKPPPPKKTVSQKKPLVRTTNFHTRVKSMISYRYYNYTILNPKKVVKQ